MTKSRDVWVIGLILAVALAVGGAGVAFPVPRLLLQIVALAGALYFLVTTRSWRLPRQSMLALLLLVAALLLPLAQLVPLPPSVWTQIPGRTLPAEVDAALGISAWRPLTLNIEGTLRSFLNLIPAAVVFAGSLFVARSGRARLLWVVLAFALLSALLGIVQLVTGGSLTPYPSSHSGSPVGLFVNRNHNAALMLVAMPVAVALASMQVARGKPQTPWFIASVSAMVVFAVIVVGTTSRTGLLLLPVAILASLILLLSRRPPLRLVVLIALALAAVTSAILASGRLDQTIGRFSGLHDARFNYWNDIRWALDHYGLAGTGFGTFVPVYKSAESLDSVVPQIINHAHNDYLEVLLEGGIPAVVLVLAFVALLAAALLRLLRDQTQREQSAVTAAAFVGILILLAVSIVDYPLRMPALSAVFALLCALLLPSQAPERPPQGRRPAAAADVEAPRKRLPIPVLAAGVAGMAAFLVLSVQAGASAYQLSRGRSEAASTWAGWSAEAHARLATEALLRGNVNRALPHAQRTRELFPVSASAVRTVGLAYLSRGDVNRGNRIMQSAVVLGWRDPLTQLWAIEAAKTSREPEKAVQRAEALYRQWVLAAAATTQLLNSAFADEAVPLLAQRLATRPDWRRHFFHASGTLPPATAGAWIRLVEALKNTPAPVSVEEGKPALNALVEAKRIEEAQRLWLLLHHPARLVSNGDFETLPDSGRNSGPAHWQVPSRNGRLVRADPSPRDADNRALRIRSLEDPTILEQRLLLQPGTYGLSYRAHATPPTPAELRWELRCLAGQPTVQAADALVEPTSGWQEFGATFIVPLQDCPIQRLALKRTGVTPIENLWIDDIRILRRAR